MAERECPNCGHATGTTDEKFCPKCGQATVAIKVESPKLAPKKKG